jgi:cation/acetate symporter
MGISFQLAVVLTGIFMLAYVIFGGMLATTWVQIVKAVMLMTATTILTILVVIKVGGNPLNLFTQARDASPEGAKYLAPGLNYTNPIDTVSLGLGLVLGTAGLPHILMRFFTVPTAKAARTSVVWAIGLIGAFYLMTTALGFGARALIGGTELESGIDKAGNLAAPRLAEFIGGGAGTFGGDLFLAIIAAVAFATILAVVAGLVISASGAMAHDVWNGIVKRGTATDKEEMWAGRVAALLVGVVAIVVAVIGGEGLNVSFMVGLAFAVAASANFPALLLALTWRRFNTTGALTGVAFGVVSAILLIVVSPGVWPGSGGSPIGWDLKNPGIVSIPLGFFGCWLGTVLSSDSSTQDKFDELRVRAETGLGAEEATAH